MTGTERTRALLDSDPSQEFIVSRVALDVLVRDSEALAEAHREVGYWRTRAEDAQAARPSITDDMVERATMALLGHDCDRSPGVDWHACRDLPVNEWREKMRGALTSALADAPTPGEEGRDG